MKNKTLITIFTAITALLLSTGCFNNYGTLIEFNGGELYYTEFVTEAEANRLGEFLVETGYYDGIEKTVQITKDEGTYQFRMVSKEGAAEDPEFIELAGLYAQEMAEYVFNGAPVEVHFCDGRLKTLRVVQMREK